MESALKTTPQAKSPGHSKVELSDLKKSSVDVVRDIQAGVVQYVEDDGKIIAAILPFHQGDDSEADLAWEALESLGREADRASRNSKSTVQILSEMRR